MSSDLWDVQNASNRIYEKNPLLVFFQERKGEGCCGCGVELGADNDDQDDDFDED